MLYSFVIFLVYSVLLNGFPNMYANHSIWYVQTKLLAIKYNLGLNIPILHCYAVMLRILF